MKIQIKPRDNSRTYSTQLEVGDYIPYFYIENEGQKLDIQVKASNFNLLVFVPHLFKAQVEEALSLNFDCQVIVITDDCTAINHPRLFHDRAIFQKFNKFDDLVAVYLCDANLKVKAVSQGHDVLTVLAEIPSPTEIASSQVPAPVLLVPDVISEDLADRLVKYLTENEASSHIDFSDYKSRSHIHPDEDLETELDDKLSKSLLPEIEKVFYSKISHRETYKVCRYSAEKAGCFGKHRDTIDPHLHRRYAMTLVLGDEYEGGGICFPEYNDEVLDIPKGWAVIFPGSLFHKVQNIEAGNRYVLISFLFTEAEARLKEDSERYRFKVLRDDCDISINKLTPDYDL